MVILENVRSALNWMLVNIEQKIWKKLENMTGKEAKIQSELSLTKKLQKLGELKMKEGQKRIKQLLMQLKKVKLLNSLALDVAKKVLLLIMKITTNLWKLFGCANLVINKDIKKLTKF